MTVQFANPLPFKMEAASLCLNLENDGLLHGNPWLLHLFIITWDSVQQNHPSG